MKKASDLRIPFVWEDRRPVLLERFLYVPDPYDKHEEWTPVSWNDPAIFGNDHPVALEYCSGNGQWISERAKQNPHINWVAIDIRFDRSRKTWTRLHRENISNLYVMCGDAAILTKHYIPEKSLSEIFVNFPDPWPKLRHAKHRLIQAPFLKDVAKVATKGSPLTFVTDDEMYASQMLRELAQCPEWSPRLPAPHYAIDWEDYGGSYFFDLWKKKGKKYPLHPLHRNLMTIILPCRSTDDLNWKRILEGIHPLKKIVWEFDLGLDTPYFPIEDELVFSSLKLALTQFKDEVWPLFSEKTSSAILYRGSLDFASFFKWSDTQEENWRLWKSSRPDLFEGHLRRLFARDAFALYFQMLAHALPDELPLSLHFNTEGCGSFAEKRQLLSKDCFEHFLITTEESTANFAILMPEEEFCTSSILSKLDHLFTEMKESYRVIEEAFLTESWEGVDFLYVISEGVSPRGKRKLKGFSAAGGVVIVEGESLGLPSEISAEKYRGRGI